MDSIRSCCLLGELWIRSYIKTFYICLPFKAEKCYYLQIIDCFIVMKQSILNTSKRSPFQRQLNSATGPCGLLGAFPKTTGTASRTKGKRKVKVGRSCCLRLLIVELHGKELLSEAARCKLYGIFSLLTPWEIKVHCFKFKSNFAGIPHLYTSYPRKDGSLCPFGLF